MSIIDAPLPVPVRHLRLCTGNDRLHVFVESLVNSQSLPGNRPGKKVLSIPVDIDWSSPHSARVGIEVFEDQFCDLRRFRVAAGPDGEVDQ